MSAPRCGMSACLHGGWRLSQSPLYSDGRVEGRYTQVLCVYSVCVCVCVCVCVQMSRSYRLYTRLRRPRFMGLMSSKEKADGVLVSAAPAGRYM